MNIYARSRSKPEAKPDRKIRILMEYPDSWYKIERQHWMQDGIHNRQMEMNPDTEGKTWPQNQNTPSIPAKFISRFLHKYIHSNIIIFLQTIKMKENFYQVYIFWSLDNEINRQMKVSGSLQNLFLDFKENIISFLGQIKINF